MSAFFITFKKANELSMANLSNTELSKFRNGRYRWQTFLEKIESGEPFELEPKSATRFGTQKSILVPVSEDFTNLVEEGLKTGNFSKLTYSKFYLGESETIVGLTNLQKTEEFGRSGGCAGGSDQTEKIEALTAILCAVKAGGKSSCSSVDFSQISLDKSWYTSLSETVENITESELTTNLKDYHYQDDLVGAIQRNYNRVRKGTRFAYKQLNKWNPADIWVSSGSIDTGSLDRASSLEELQSICYSDRIRGISLKKGGTEVKLVDSSEDKEWQVEQCRILTNFDASDTYTLRIGFNFVGGSEKELVIRPNGTSFKAEVRTVGGNHRNGSCGQAQLNSCLRACWKTKFRFNLHEGIQANTEDLNQDEKIRKVARKQLKRFVALFEKCPESIQHLVIADIARHCVCQSRGHCTYLKVS